MNETWIIHCIPESREGSKQWVQPGESAPKRPKTQQSAGKVMASVFLGCTWSNLHLLITLLDQLIDKIRKKQLHLKNKKILFHYDTSHTSKIAQAKKHELCFESSFWIEAGWKHWIQLEKYEIGKRIASVYMEHVLLSVSKPQKIGVWNKTDFCKKT